VYDDDRDTFCLDWWAPNYTKIKEMARAQHVRSTPSRAQICRSQMIYRHSKNKAPEFIGETTLKETRDRVQDAETQRLTARKGAALNMRTRAAGLGGTSQELENPNLLSGGDDEERHWAVKPAAASAPRK
jgi:hypothetical protein